jgi:hypothetical protein
MVGELVEFANKKTKRDAVNAALVANGWTANYRDNIMGMGKDFAAYTHEAREAVLERTSKWTPVLDPVPESLPPAAVGDKIEVFWEDDGSYYAAEVKSYNNAKNEYKVEYKDQSTEWLTLRNPKTDGNANGKTKGVDKGEDVAWRMSTASKSKAKKGAKKRKQQPVVAVAVAADVDADTENQLRPESMLLENGKELKNEAMEFISAASKRLKLLHSTAGKELVPYPHQHLSRYSSSGYSPVLDTQREKLLASITSFVCDGNIEVDDVAKEATAYGTAAAVAGE